MLMMSTTAGFFINILYCNCMVLCLADLLRSRHPLTHLRIPLLQFLHENMLCSLYACIMYTAIVLIIFIFFDQRFSVIREIRAEFCTKFFFYCMNIGALYIIADCCFVSSNFHPLAARHKRAWGPKPYSLL